MSGKYNLHVEISQNQPIPGHIWNPGILELDFQCRISKFRHSWIYKKTAMEFLILFPPITWVLVKGSKNQLFGFRHPPLELLKSLFRAEADSVLKFFGTNLRNALPKTNGQHFIARKLIYFLSHYYWKLEAARGLFCTLLWLLLLKMARNIRNLTEPKVLCKSHYGNSHLETGVSKWEAPHWGVVLDIF